MASGIHGDASAFVLVAATQVGGVDERRARRIQLRDKGIATKGKDATELGLESPRSCGEVRRFGKAREVRIAGAIDGHV